MEDMMNSITKIEALDQMAELIQTSWTYNADAKDQYFQRTYPNWTNAVSWSLNGALLKVFGIADYHLDNSGKRIWADAHALRVELIKDLPANIRSKGINYFNDYAKSENDVLALIQKTKERLLRRGSRLSQCLYSSSNGTLSHCPNKSDETNSNYYRSLYCVAHVAHADKILQYDQRSAST